MSTLTTTSVHPRVTLAILPLLAIAATAINLRTAVTGFSPLLETIGADLDFGPAVYGIFGTIVTASFAVFGLLAPLIARTLSLEVTIAIATMLTTTGVLLRAGAPGTAGLIASTVIAFAGVGASNVLIVPLVKKYFPQHLKLVTSMYLALLQVGQFVAPLSTVPLADAGGWRFAIGIWAAPVALATVLWIVVMLRSRRTQPAVIAAKPGRIAGAWRSSLLWSMVLLFGMTALNTYAIISWLPTILTDAGIAPATSATLLALFSVFGLGAAFVIPPLTLRLRSPFGIVLACSLLLAVGYAGLAASPLAGTIAWVVCLGLGVSTFPMCLTLINARTRTPAGSATLSGAMQGLGYGLACVGPLCIGLLYGATRTWTGSFVLLFASVAVMIVSGWVASRPRLLEDAVEPRTSR